MAHVKRNDVTKRENPSPAAAETGRPTPIIACTGAATIALPANRLRMLAPADSSDFKCENHVARPKLSCFFEHGSTCKCLQSQCSCSSDFGHKPQLWCQSQLVAVLCSGRHSALRASCEQPHKKMKGAAEHCKTNLSLWHRRTFAKVRSSFARSISASKDAFSIACVSPEQPTFNTQ